MTVLVQGLLSDSGLLFFAVAGLAATTVAILRDTRAQQQAETSEFRLDA